MENLPIFELTDNEKFELASEGIFQFNNNWKLYYDKDNNLFSCMYLKDAPEFYLNMDDLLTRDNKLRVWFEVYVMKNNKKKIIFESFDLDISEQLCREEGGYINIVVDKGGDLVYYEFKK